MSERDAELLHAELGAQVVRGDEADDLDRLDRVGEPLLEPVDRVLGDVLLLLPHVATDAHELRVDIQAERVVFGLVGEDEVEGLPPEERERGGGVGGRVRRGHRLLRYTRTSHCYAPPPLHLTQGRNTVSALHLSPISGLGTYILIGVVG